MWTNDVIDLTADDSNQEEPDHQYDPELEQALRLSREETLPTVSQTYLGASQQSSDEVIDLTLSPDPEPANAPTVKASSSITDYYQPQHKKVTLHALIAVARVNGDMYSVCSHASRPFLKLEPPLVRHP